jgi:hypothetical protein
VLANPVTALYAVKIYAHFVHGVAPTIAVKSNKCNQLTKPAYFVYQYVISYVKSEDKMIGKIVSY